jgi:glc operon protein GlcG
MSSMMSWKLGVLAGWLIVTPALSQSVPAARPARPPPVMGTPARLDLARAQKALAAAQAVAAAADVHVAIAVVDANGDLVAFLRNDGAPSLAVTTSQGKARAAILFGVRTKLVQDAIAKHQPLTVRVTAPQLGAWELTPMQGGVPIFQDGKLLGAVGVGGSAPPMDEHIAQAGVDAIQNN